MPILDLIDHLPIRVIFLLTSPTLRPSRLADRAGRIPVVFVARERRDFFQHRPPIDPSSLTRWRKRIGEEGVEWLLTKTIEAGRASHAVEDKSLARVSVGTPVMEKNIAHPNDARPYETARQKLVALAAEAGIELRQTHARLAVKGGR